MTSPVESEAQAAFTLAETRLRGAAVRGTAARVKVLAALLTARCAVTHQDLCDHLSGMDRVTLYRALDCLTAAGLAHRIPGDDRVFRYSAGAEQEAAQEPHRHGHFKCTRCERVFCIEPAGGQNQALSRQLQAALRSALGQGFQGHDIELTIKGWCADCSH